MRRLEISRLADADLDDILEYGTKIHGEAAADAYYFSFQAAFDLLCLHPEAGQIDEETRLNLRRWHHQKHRIFYKHDATTLLIVRIFHHSIDLKSQFER